MEYKDLLNDMIEAAGSGSVVYVYDDGRTNINAKGLKNVLISSGHNIIEEIDCTDINNWSKERIADWLDMLINDNKKLENLID